MRRVRRVISYAFGAAIIIFTLTITAAYADCFFEGYWYPTGYRIGPYVCAPDGSWVYRP